MVSGLGERVCGQSVDVKVSGLEECTVRAGEGVGSLRRGRGRRDEVTVPLFEVSNVIGCYEAGSGVTTKVGSGVSKAGSGVTLRKRGTVSPRFFWLHLHLHTQYTVCGGDHAAFVVVRSIVAALIYGEQLMIVCIGSVGVQSCQ